MTEQQLRVDLRRRLLIKLPAIAAIAALGYAMWNTGLWTKPLAVIASFLAAAAVNAVANGRFAGHPWQTGLIVLLGIVGGVWHKENRAMPLAYRWLWTAVYLVLPLAAYAVGRWMRRNAERRQDQQAQA